MTEQSIDPRFAKRHDGTESQPGDVLTYREGKSAFEALPTSLIASDGGELTVVPGHYGSTVLDNVTLQAATAAKRLLELLVAQGTKPMTGGELRAVWQQAELDDDLLWLALGLLTAKDVLECLPFYTRDIPIEQLKWQVDARCRVLYDAAKRRDVP